MLLPSFELGNFVWEPNKYVVCFNMLFDREAQYKHGILTSLSKIFSDRGIPILSIKTTISIKENAVRLTLFADFAQRKNLLREVENHIRGLNYIKDIKVIEPLFNGITVDTTYTYLTFTGERAIVLRKPLFEGLIKGVREKFGESGKTFLYHVGFILGQKAYKTQSEIVRKAHGSIKETVLFTEELFKQVGFGILKISELDLLNKRATIEIHNSFECELFKGSKKPESHLIRGLIAGFMSAFFRIKVSASEVKCIAKGDPYCLFLVG